MRLLAERDGLFFVDLDCSRCGSHTVAIVTVELDHSEVTIEVSDAATPGDFVEHLGEDLPIGASPVTADDVLDMHEFLVRHEGDLSALARPGAQRSDGAGRR